MVRLDLPPSATRILDASTVTVSEATSPSSRSRKVTSTLIVLVVTSDAPITGPVVHDSSQLLEVVALGQAVALVPDSLAQVASRPDVAFRPVRDASPYVVSIAWQAGSRDRRVAAFVRAAVEALTQPAVGAAG